MTVALSMMMFTLCSTTYRERAHVSSQKDEQWFNEGLAGDRTCSVLGCPLAC